MSALAAGRLLFRSSLRTASRTFQRPCRMQAQSHQWQQSALRAAFTSQSRRFSVHSRSRAGLMPDTEDPQPPKESPPEQVAQHPAELSDDQYHELADEYMDTVHEKAELLQEGREDIEVEYAAGVLNIVFPPNGTYVINKQPPNKQIWLSSPISGPKRYDWVVEGEGMHQKEGGGTGEWVYLRDGTKLSALLSKELGISIDHHEEELEVSKDPTE
ncbi:hypothetical protein AC579_2764 [Pseudocercospora musae]|uniref:ferroxidase n=1 Tax=Pseudocercospora musae TaxID=113226 RepID=A0A139IIC7_9PEZI|nr:hypothetical protein AC579_2764 [Pseudocercospora musae]